MAQRVRKDTTPMLLPLAAVDRCNDGDGCQTGKPGLWASYYETWKAPLQPQGSRPLLWPLCVVGASLDLVWGDSLCEVCGAGAFGYSRYGSICGEVEGEGGGMKIRWEVSDGYVGGSRPHYLIGPDDELEGLSEQEQDDIIEDYVQHAFNDRVGFSWYRME